MRTLQNPDRPNPHMNDAGIPSYTHSTLILEIN
jgi:hypothetical protein